MIKTLEKRQRILLLLYAEALFLFVYVVFLPPIGKFYIIVINFLITLPLFGLLLLVFRKICPAAEKGRAQGCL